jgi:hypothetical protein
LVGAVEREGMTLVPLKLYFQKGRAKLELALARGKKLYDKREVLLGARARAADAAEGLKIESRELRVGVAQPWQVLIMRAASTKARLGQPNLFAPFVRALPKTDPRPASILLNKFDSGCFKGFPQRRHGRQVRGHGAWF